MVDDQRQLEQALRQLGAEMAWPATPDLVRGLRQRLEASPPRRRRSRRRVLVLVLAVLLLAAGTALALDRISFDGISVERVPTLPRIPARPPAGSLLHLGRRVSAARAARALDHPLLVPAALGRPDAVYLQRHAAEAIVTLVYRPRPSLPNARQTGVGALVTEMRATTQAAIVQKLVGPGTIVRPTSVNGAPALWLAGAPHEILVQPPSGDFVPETLRLATNTLIVQPAPLLVRIEAHIALSRALAIARSLRAGG